MSERTYSEVMDDFRHHIAADESVTTDPEDIFAIEARINKGLADGLDAAHKREIDVLKQRCAELNAEVAAKDAVIQRLNDAIAEEQRCHLATTKNSSAVGDTAKLREAMRLVSRVAEQMTRGTITGEAPTRKEVDDWAMRLCDIIGAALAAPARNCDVLETEELIRQHNSFCGNSKNSYKCINASASECRRCLAKFMQTPYVDKKGEAK